MTAGGRRRYAAALWVLLGLFALRVAGQLLIAVGAGGFLPPWEEWFSGALGYPALLASQMLIIVVCGRIALDVTRGRGFFATPRRQVGAALLAFGSIAPSIPWFDRTSARSALACSLMRRFASSSWARTSGVMNPSGRWRARGRCPGICEAVAGRTLSPATAV